MRKQIDLAEESLRDAQKVTAVKSWLKNLGQKLKEHLQFAVTSKPSASICDSWEENRQLKSQFQQSDAALFAARSSQRSQNLMSKFLQTPSWAEALNI